MSSEQGAGTSAQYVPMVYAHRWDGGHLFSGGCALMASVLSLAVLRINTVHGVAAGAVALLFWSAFALGVAEKRRMHVRIDRRGIELRRLRSVLRVEWHAIADVRMEHSSSGTRDMIVIALRDRNARDLSITDRWDMPINDIFERIVRNWKHAIDIERPAKAIG